MSTTNGIDSSPRFANSSTPPTRWASHTCGRKPPTTFWLASPASPYARSRSTTASRLCREPLVRDTSVEAQLDNDVRQGPNREVFEAVAADFQAFTQHLASAVESIVVAVRTAEVQTRAHAAALAERHAVQEADYRTIVAASEEQGGAPPNASRCRPRLPTHRPQQTSSWPKRSRDKA